MQRTGSEGGRSLAEATAEGKSPEERKIDGAFNCCMQFFCSRNVDCLRHAGIRALQVLMNGTVISNSNLLNWGVLSVDCRIAWPPPSQTQTALLSADFGFRYYLAKTYIQYTDCRVKDQSAQPSMSGHLFQPIGQIPSQECWHFFLFFFGKLCSQEASRVDSYISEQSRREEYKNL